MNFVQFIDKRQSDWNTLEKLTQKANTKTQLNETEIEKLANLYRAATADYAYALANFPNERITLYLARLISEAHGVIYQIPRLSWFKIKRFFLYSGPQLFRIYKIYLWISALIFVVFSILGFWACEFHKSYEKKILGTDYVLMTENNIRNKKPFNVYADKYKFLPFAEIMFNNITVLLKGFMLGLTACLGTLYLLITNAIMVGCFFHIFYRHDIITDFWLTIMVHGTIELTMIVFGCGIGFMLGWKVLFPGHYTRRDVFRIYGFDAIKMAIICAFWLIIAAFLEAFVTGLFAEGLPQYRLFSGMIVLFSALILYLYFGRLGRKDIKPTWFA
ncbi:MAG: stage II sporulation protein M [Bacteroidia bacterium]|nr:stage II sporulation protein M [Bacteroidia bacterium]MDW8346905.1 stage II sporulation protein M [Bacteroidia bacterium]